MFCLFAWYWFTFGPALGPYYWQNAATDVVPLNTIRQRWDALGQACSRQLSSQSVVDISQRPWRDLAFNAVTSFKCFFPSLSVVRYLFGSSVLDINKNLNTPGIFVAEDPAYPWSWKRDASALNHRDTDIILISNFIIKHYGL